MLHVACVVYCNQDVSMAPQRWHEALHHCQSSSLSASSLWWYLSVEKTVRSIVSRLCGWTHQPQAKDSAWKPQSSTSSPPPSTTPTSTSSLLPKIVAKVQKFYCQTLLLLLKSSHPHNVLAPACLLDSQEFAPWFVLLTAATYIIITCK